MTCQESFNKSQLTEKHTYEVTVTNTGSICVQAASKEDAIETVLLMSNTEIINNANLCCWEPSDAELVDEN